MKSPQQLAVQLARQWQSSHWRTQHLLPGTGAWPLRLAIGAPDSQTFRHAGTLHCVGTYNNGKPYTKQAPAVCNGKRVATVARPQR
jgi:hypothetical protein